MQETTTPIEQLIALRKEKAVKLKNLGINPYPAKSGYELPVKIIQEKYKDLKTGESSKDVVSVCGRITARREMGKATFIDLTDTTGKIQGYLKADTLGAENFKVFKDLVDLSDFISIKGAPFRTKSGELSIFAESWAFLSKALRPLPEKWHGLKDTETRYRQRYLDLISNEEVKEVFVKRSQVISTIRKELESLGFLEVETPIMQKIAGGAAAKPFITHHNALDMDLFLRIAPELYLKRLVTGGMERVFEIGRNFRNEGIDRDHNPEFTMLELYQAYSDYEGMMDLCERLILASAQKIGAELKTPFRRARLFSLLEEFTGQDLRPFVGSSEMKSLIKKFNLDIPQDTPEHKILDHIFDEKVIPHLKEPVFVMDYPALYSPLAKSKADDPFIAERFELYMNGKEIANAYSELNDPEEQRKRLALQQEAKKKGDEDAEPYDEDFVVALEHGMPPTGGLGIGHRPLGDDPGQN